MNAAIANQPDNYLGVDARGRAHWRHVTELPAFRAWFGNSQVVDAEGHPLVVYHGTTTPFEAFDPARAGAHDTGYLGRAFYFGDRQWANIYARAGAHESGGAQGGLVMPVYLCMQRPLKLHAQFEGRREVDRAVVVRQALHLPASATAAEVSAAAQAQGYDGVMYTLHDDTEYAVFQPTQVKSAIGNRGTFGPEADVAKADAADRGRALAELAHTLHPGAHEAATSPHNDRPYPTHAQIKANNAKLGVIRWRGLVLRIENPAGSVRTGLMPDKTPWVRMFKGAHYGYILTVDGQKAPRGHDKDHVDVLVGPDIDSDRVFVVNQTRGDGKSFDEHKVVVGTQTVEQARALYLAQYQAGWKVGPIAEMSTADFKAWLKSAPVLHDPAPLAKAIANKPGNVLGTDSLGRTHWVKEILIQRRNTQRGGRWQVAHAQVPHDAPIAVGDKYTHSDGHEWDVVSIKPVEVTPAARPVQLRTFTRNRAYSEYALAMMDTAAIEALWQGDSLQYIPPGGARNTIGDRYARATAMLRTGAGLRKGPDEPIQVPAVFVTPSGWLEFADGRHRYAAMRDMGMTEVPISILDPALLRPEHRARVISAPTVEVAIPEETAKAAIAGQPGLYLGQDVRGRGHWRSSGGVHGMHRAARRREARYQADLTPHIRAFRRHYVQLRAHFLATLAQATVKVARDLKLRAFRVALHAGHTFEKCEHALGKYGLEVDEVVRHFYLEFPHIMHLVEPLLEAAPAVGQVVESLIKAEEYDPLPEFDLSTDVALLTLQFFGEHPDRIGAWERRLILEAEAHLVEVAGATTAKARKSKGALLLGEDVKMPGIRGGLWWRDAKGHVRYDKQHGKVEHRVPPQPASVAGTLVEPRPLPDSPLVVACGVGVDSIAMLIAMHARGIRPTAITWADTGGDSPETHAYAYALQQWLEKVGFPDLTIVRYVPKVPYDTLETNCVVNETIPGILTGKKSCSIKWKQVPQRQWLENQDWAQHTWDAGKPIVRAIGFEHEEAYRAEGYAKTYDATKAVGEVAWYPLQDWGITRADCVQLIAAAGLPPAEKSSCFFCPASQVSEIIELARRHPDLAARAIAMEDVAKSGKHPLRSFPGLNWKFSWRGLLEKSEHWPAVDAELQKLPPEKRFGSVISFASGSSHPGEFNGFAQAHVPIGVVVNEVSRPTEDLIAAYTGGHGRVFVDSGAFPAFTKACRTIAAEKGIDVKALSGEDRARASIDARASMNWPKVFAKYDALLAKCATMRPGKKTTVGHARRLYLVMPDVIGDQAATEALQWQYRATIKRFIVGKAVVVPQADPARFEVQLPGGTVLSTHSDKKEAKAAATAWHTNSARILIPIQTGAKSPSACLAQIRAEMGTDDFAVAAPSNEAAFSTEDLRDLAAARPGGIHLLGIGMRPELVPTIQLIRELAPACSITTDANRIRAWVGTKGNQPVTRRTAIRVDTAVYDATHGIGDHPEWDETELAVNAAEPGFLSPGQITDFASRLQLDPASVRAAIKAGTFSELMAEYGQYADEALYAAVRPAVQTSVAPAIRSEEIARMARKDERTRGRLVLGKAVPQPYDRTDPTTGKQIHVVPTKDRPWTHRPEPAAAPRAAAAPEARPWAHAKQAEPAPKAAAPRQPSAPAALSKPAAPSAPAAPAAPVSPTAGMKPRQAVEHHINEFNRRAEDVRTGRALPEAPRPKEPETTAPTETPQFKKWFKDSAVVDPKGKPLVVYHGTTAPDFDQFEPNYRPKEQLGFGIHFAENATVANRYADPKESTARGKGKDRAGRMIPVYLSVQKPLEADTIVMEGTPEFDLAKKLAGPKLMTQTAPNGKKIAYLQGAIDACTSNKRAQQTLEEAGYDGVHYTAHIIEPSAPGSYRKVESGKSWIVFSPTQIKSAVGNKGTFDATHPSFMKTVRDRGVALAAAWIGQRGAGSTT